ncbi:MAG: methylenetetrahydrofolate--tRNA-(uracil(54)-C(5))-methyltransferase (FADH(2)-oxidizing) TrmFO [Eubacteriales bacterium]|nr:methylenetetrahydrofolate--tRNA-(uracil(54)-C(5))-methyltransferase (FADH(2)-oxidizing) TrmFO [Eubacteriales bacterium]
MNTPEQPPHITVIGAGLAGAEAAWQAAQRGVHVQLLEMKPLHYSPAHHSPDFAELVCSNSLRSAQLFNAVGLLKEELRRMHSLILSAADATAVAAGAALAVDRTRFSAHVTQALRTHPRITVQACEVTALPDAADGIVVIATGPLTSAPLASALQEAFGVESLHFFDAAAPIVDGESIDYTHAYLSSRYGKGEAAYLNCPLTQEEYTAFYDALLHAQLAPLHDFDAQAQADLTVFEGCMPIEVMAARGIDTLRYGPFKPVGLPDPRTGKEPYAVLQLRRENAAGTMYNLVGCQTRLTFSEQRRVFSQIPALQNATFLRYGVMHRNTYLNAPALLDATYAWRSQPKFYFAGQMTGVEGYVESAASGCIAGINAARQAMGQAPFVFSPVSMMGAMASYISNPAHVRFEPMNANFGLIAPLSARVRGGKRAKYDEYVRRSLTYFDTCYKEGLLP